MGSRFKKLLIFAAKYFNGITLITEETKNYIVNSLQLKVNKYAIWTSGVNLDLFDNNKVKIVDSSITEIVNNRFALLYHGSISPNRGINLILDAMNELKSIIPDLLFISVSSNNNYIVEYCNENMFELEKNLLLINSVPNEDIPSYIRLADFCIVPLPRLTWWEISSPLKLFEYLAMSKPLILTNIKAHLNVVDKKNEFVCYFDPDIKDDLVQKLLDCYKLKDEYKRYGTEGRKLAVRYSWENQAIILNNFILGLN